MDNARYRQAGFRWLLSTLEPVGIGRGVVGTCLLVDDYIFCAELGLMGKAWDRALPLQAAAARLSLP